MFIPISKRAQFFLLAMFLGEPLNSIDTDKEFEELKDAEYIDESFAVTKKGEAYCHVQNKVGVNFQSLVKNNSRKANLKLLDLVQQALAEEVHHSHTEIVEGAH